ncbi:hypothetical protein MRB56_09245 [Halomonas cupida]|uniref:hypothetical protein n=1 Tax=Halomonas cupida TaxID=44933 RepID=UPI0039B62CB3
MSIHLRDRQSFMAEWRAQRRARGHVISKPERPVISSHWTEPKDPANAARAVEFYARWHGQKEPRVILWA